jgi:hypothetical protein
MAEITSEHARAAAMTYSTHTIRTAALKSHGYYRQILDKTRDGQPLDEHGSGQPNNSSRMLLEDRGDWLTYRVNRSVVLM